MQHNILIAGCATRRGLKISRFLQHKGLLVYGVDRYVPTEDHVARFFRFDMRHRDSMKLVMSITKPDILIFCPEVTGRVENNFPTYVNLLDTAISEKKIIKNVLCLDDIYQQPKEVNEITQLALYQLAKIAQDSQVIETLIITEKSNLLKEIKHFVGVQNSEESDTT